MAFSGHGDRLSLPRELRSRCKKRAAAQRTVATKRLQNASGLRIERGSLFARTEFWRWQRGTGWPRPSDDIGGDREPARRASLGLDHPAFGMQPVERRRARACSSCTPAASPGYSHREQPLPATSESAVMGDRAPMVRAPRPAAAAAAGRVS